jgi:hypothetical protein
VVVVAGAARVRVLEEAHDSPYSGHFGKHKVLHQINQNFWWPGWRKDVESYVFGCLVCLRNKAQTVKKVGLLQPLSIPSFKWESVSMDFITQLPVTKTGYDAIAVFVDRLTKMVHFAPTYTDCSARDVARLINDTVFKHHGLPSELISDRDPRFTSEFWTELTRLLGTKLKMSTAFHPQTDGQTERSNGVLEDYLRHYISPSQDDWDEWLPQAEFSVNNAWQESIKNTLFMLNFGQQPRTPLLRAVVGKFVFPKPVTLRELWKKIWHVRRLLFLRLGLARSYLLTKDVVKLNSMWDKMSCSLQSTSSLRIQGRASCYQVGRTVQGDRTDWQGRLQGRTFAKS